MEALGKIVAKMIYYYDNDSYMYRPKQLGLLNCCSLCNVPLARNVNPDFRLSKREYDISATYDGYFIVSNVFKEFCISNGFEGLNFYNLKFEADFCLLLDTDNVVYLDHERRGTKFDEYCQVCERYNSVAGGSPNFLKKSGQILLNTIYTSDILYGYKNSQHPLFIINLELYHLMKKENFKGIYFNDVYF
jgi:hypothetical protein